MPSCNISATFFTSGSGAVAAENGTGSSVSTRGQLDIQSNGDSNARSETVFASKGQNMTGTVDTDTGVIAQNGSLTGELDLMEQVTKTPMGSIRGDHRSFRKTRILPL